MENKKDSRISLGVCDLFVDYTHPRGSPFPPPSLKYENPGIHKPQIRKTYIGLNW